MDRRPRARRRAVLALVSVLTLVAVTATAAVLAAESERDSRRSEERAAALQASGVLEATLGRATAALAGSSSLVDAGGSIDPARFRRWTDGILPESPVATLAYAQVTPASDRPATEAAYGIGVKDLVDGGFRPSAEREWHLPVVLVGPDDAERRASLGFDLRSSSVRSLPATASISTGDDRATGLLRSPGSGQRAIVVYHPVASADGSVRGVVAAQVRVRDLIDIMETQLPSGTAVRVTDGEDVVMEIGEPQEGSAQREVEVLGRDWTVTAEREAMATQRSGTILAGGLTATAFLALVFVLWLRRDSRIESRQKLIEDLTANTPDPIFIKSVDGTYLFANDSASRLLSPLGAPDLIGRDDSEVLPSTTAAALRAHDLEVIGADRSMEFEEVIPTSDGRDRWFLTTRSPHRDPSGRVIGVFAVARDITERRLDEARRAAVADLAYAVGSRTTVNDVADAAASTIRRALGADVVRIAVRSGERQLEVLAAEGAGLLTDFDRYVPVDASHALATAARERVVVTVSDRAEWLERFPEAGPMILAEDLQATICQPFLAALQEGALSVAFRDAHHFDEHEKRTVADLVAVLGEALARAHSTELERDTVATLQHALLPVDTFPDTPMDIAVRYSPALRGLELGGDWYDLFALGGGRVGVVCGDVVGRGAAAAAVMGQLRAALRAISMSFDEPAEVLRELDRFTATTDGGFCTTVVYGVLDPTGLTFTFSSAGHLPPLLSDPASGSRLLDDVRGLPLGVDPAGAVREQTTISLSPGATLVLFTDGLVERRERPIDEGLDRLADLVDRDRRLPIEAFADALLAGASEDDGAEDDDTALLCIHLPGRDESTLTCRLDAELSGLAELRERLRSWLDQRDVDESDSEDLVLATIEAVTNSIEHGYRRDPRNQTVVELADEEGTVRVTVRDRGRWNGRRPKADRGRGLRIIETVMDDARVTSNRHGTTIHMERQVRRRAETTATVDV